MVGNVCLVKLEDKNVFGPMVHQQRVPPLIKQTYPSNTSMRVITRAENTKDEDIPEAMDDIGHLNANVIVPSSQ